MFDIKDESLGFIHWLGELVIVPYIYSLPLRYASVHPSKLTQPALVAAFLLFGEYYITQVEMFPKFYEILKRNQSAA